MESLFIRNEPYKDENGEIKWRLKGMQATQAQVYEINGELRFDKALPVDLNKADESLKDSILGAQLTAALNANEILAQENAILKAQLEAKDSRIAELEAAEAGLNELKTKIEAL